MIGEQSEREHEEREGSCTEAHTKRGERRSGETIGKRSPYSSREGEDRRRPRYAYKASRRTSRSPVKKRKRKLSVSDIDSPSMCLSLSLSVLFVGQNIVSASVPRSSSFPLFLSPLPDLRTSNGHSCFCSRDCLGSGTSTAERAQRNKRAQ